MTPKTRSGEVKVASTEKLWATWMLSSTSPR